VPEIDVILDNYGQSKQALKTAEADAEAELIAAKAAYAAGPNPGRLKRKKDAVVAIQRIRAVVREGRTGNQVGGDAMRTGG
jgi:hypothetical protein